MTWGRVVGQGKLHEQRREIAQACLALDGAGGRWSFGY